MPYNVSQIGVVRIINDKFNYMYEFEKHPKLTEFIQEMANTGKAPREWTSFIETLNEALRIQDVVGQSEQFYCADWNRCGSLCEEQCNACNKAENMPEVAQ